MSNGYSIWIHNGQALLGEFCPEGTVTSVPLLRLKVEPPAYPTNEIDIYFESKADMIATARTLRGITEALERTLWPELEPDWSVLPLGVLGE